jgi:hypothetical protein
MPNSAEHARRWTEFLAMRSEIRNGWRLSEHFRAGRITRLCDCGCNSYEIEVVPEQGLLPLVGPSNHRGSVFQLEFRTRDESRTVGLSVFADERGYLSGIDVDCSGNAFPMMESPQLIEPPFHTYGQMKA